MNHWKTYKNGNYIVHINLLDGTRIRETEEDDFVSDFATNIDMKATNYCDRNCEFCHEGSSKTGRHGDIMNEKFIETLHPYQELALGGGDITSHPDLIPFLRKLKEKEIIPNITVHQQHFEQKQSLIRQLVDEGLIYGLGVSVSNPTPKFIELVKQYPNAVLHVINGIFSVSDAKALSGHNLKLLILGYKHLRRGTEHFMKERNTVLMNQNWLYNNLQSLFDKFAVVSFDNLALEQLGVKRLIPEKDWENYYAGDDGTSTFYIDTVERKFAKSSTANFGDRYDLLDSVDDMFQVIQNEFDVAPPQKI